MTPPLYIVVHHPPGFARRSGFAQLLEVSQARLLDYQITWERLQKRSWTLGHRLYQWGVRHYGSEWNALVPYWDELRLSRGVRESRGAVVHFLFADFASPRHAGWFRRAGNRVVGTFHCSLRRLPKVLGRFTCWPSFDALSVTSRTMLPFFQEQGFRADQLHVVRLGVDADHFRPDPGWTPPPGGPLRAILIGKTERDHEFVAEVLRRCRPGTVELKVCTHPSYHPVYRDVPGAVVLPYVPDEELLRLNQQAELMIMPFLDCTSNDALLEAMACGTPVLTNRIGGIPEYVDEACNHVLETDRTAADWADYLHALHAGRERLWAARPAVRAWAETFSWPRVLADYHALYGWPVGG